MDSRVVVEGSIDARKTAYHVQNPSQSRALQALSAPPLRPLHSVPYIGDGTSRDGAWSENNTMGGRVVVEGSVDARKTA
ncbi:hypothetical protein N7G274_010794, partial [Stereocaulon virgatum]